MKHTVIFAALLLLLTACACGKTNAPKVPDPTAAPNSTSDVPGSTSDPLDGEGTLICLTDTEKEAQEIAELYGIELLRWEQGVATFGTDEDLRSVIRRGQQNGWPELSVNRSVHLF